MDNTYINIRIGKRHLQVFRGGKIKFLVNTFWIQNKPDKFFRVYNFFGWGSNG